MCLCLLWSHRVQMLYHTDCTHLSQACRDGDWSYEAPLKNVFCGVQQPSALPHPNALFMSRHCNSFVLKQSSEDLRTFPEDIGMSEM